MRFGVYPWRRLETKAKGGTAAPTRGWGARGPLRAPGACAFPFFFFPGCRIWKLAILSGGPDVYLDSGQVHPPGTFNICDAHGCSLDYQVRMAGLTGGPGTNK